ncbi:hypothetical protein BX600DRAFT_534880 [Xylariales sp. PMI_506]|nr:hypothetical protein BX600DRAFT_534880 [Xylariales sp. PMI_506]
MPSATPHVLILGAGLGGLTLAQSLRKNGVSFEIFERDHDNHDRLQGWAISLHGMLDDIKESFPSDLPPIDVVSLLSPLPFAPEFALYSNSDPTKKLGVRDDGSGQIIRANRALLREWLSTNIPINYQKHAVRIEEDDDSVTVHFADGTSATGDIVIGADGVHSVTRKHIFGGKDEYLQREPAAAISGDFKLDGSVMELQLELASCSYVVGFEDPNGEKSFFYVGLDGALPDGKSGNYYFHVMWPDQGAAHDDFWTYSAAPKELHDFVVQKTQTLAPDFKSVIPFTTAEGIKSPLVRYHTLIIPALPVGRVTLLGDAAHAMTPFRGEGGSHAIRDALNLARALAKIDKTSEGSRKKIIGAYQQEMLERGGKAASLSSAAFDEKKDPKQAQARYIAGHPARPLPREKITL